MFILDLFNATIALCVNAPMTDEFRSYACQYPVSGLSIDVRWFYFCLNKLVIDAVNEGQKNFTLGLNEYADMDPTSFLDRYTGFGERRDFSTNNTLFIDYELNNNITRDQIKSVPNSIDYRHLLSTPRNQRECQSCYAHAALSGLSAKYALAKNLTNVLFSVQYYLNCGDHNTCMGGDPTEITLHEKEFDFVLETNFPYAGAVGPCPQSIPKIKGDFYHKIFRYTSLDSYVIKHLLATHGPLIAGISSTSPYIQFYRDGIYDKECETSSVNHLVVIMGYGQVDYGLDYWIVRNSLGSNWGDGGYIKIRAGLNLCNIESSIYFLT